MDSELLSRSANRERMAFLEVLWIALAHSSVVGASGPRALRLPPCCLVDRDPKVCLPPSRSSSECVLEGCGETMCAEH